VLAAKFPVMSAMPPVATKFGSHQSVAMGQEATFEM
jgi:hypothetical protein